LQCPAVKWSGEIKNDLNVYPERGDTGSRDAVAEDAEFGDSKHALLQVQGQLLGGKDGEEPPQVFPVLLQGLAVDTIII